MTPKRVVILGGGIAGLAAAHRLWELQKQNGKRFEITLLEAENRLGGTLQTEEYDGFILEKGPDAFLSQKPAALQLCRRLGIQGEILETSPDNRKNFVVYRGRLTELPKGFYLIAPTDFGTFLRTPLFSPAAKLRMACELLIPPKKNSEDESVASFVTRRFGKEVLERVGQPMLAGIYAGDPQNLSLRSTLPRFSDLETKYGSVIRGLLREAGALKANKKEAVQGPRYSLFLSFKKGMETLAKSLEHALPRETFCLGFRTAGVSYDAGAGRWYIKEEGAGRTVEADALVLACPARVSAQFLKNSLPELARRLEEIRYESVATVNLAYRASDIRHPLDGFGFVTPASEKSLSVLACTFANRKFAGRAPKDTVLLRAFVGGAFGRIHFQKDDRSLLRGVEEDLSGLLGIRGRALLSRIQRYPGAMVQYRVGHRDCVGAIECQARKTPGLFLTGSSYRGVGIPDCIEDAEKQAEEIERIIQ